MPSSAPPDPADAPGLTVAAVARRLGVAPATLRTWDRRYGLGPQRHVAQTHRRYSERDIERLLMMRALVFDGVTPADAARVALQGAREPYEGRPRCTGRGGGGRVLALPAADAATRGVARAALALDGEQVLDQFRRSVHDHGLSETWLRLALPVLDAVGRRWAATGEGVEVEHLLADCLLAALRPVLAPRTRATGRPVLLAGAEGDLHGLPLYVLAAALAERGVPSRILGPDLPYRALAAAVAMSGPSVVFVWAQLDRYGDPDQLAHLPRTRPAASVVAGGPGWRHHNAPGVLFVTDLEAAVTTTVRGFAGPAAQA